MTGDDAIWLIAFPLAILVVYLYRFVYHYTRVDTERGPLRGLMWLIALGFCLWAAIAMMQRG